MWYAPTFILSRGLILYNGIYNKIKIKWGTGTNDLGKNGYLSDEIPLLKIKPPSYGLHFDVYNSRGIIKAGQGLGRL